MVLLKSLKRKIGAIAILLVLTLFFVKLNPRLRSLVTEVGKGLTIDPEARYGSGTRILNWHGAYLVIKDHWGLGVGPKAAQMALNDKYGQLGYVWPLKNEFNAHNMFLQIWLETGILGFLVLTASFLLIILKLIKLKDANLRSMLLSVLFLLLLNFLFESSFHRYSGISFFSFMYCMIAIMLTKESDILKPISK